MLLLDAELLDLTRQLSPVTNVVIALVGVFLWLFGAHTHRFWLAMAVTVTAGVAGLYLARDFGVQPLVAALLLALSAGVLCLSLARITLFLAGGLAAVLLVRAVSLSWNDFVCFIAGGLIGVCFYRMWIMAVSSLVGGVLFSYACLSLLDSFGRINVVNFVQKNGPLLHWGLAALVILGAVIQFLLERRRQAPKTKAKKKKQEPAYPQHQQPFPPPPSALPPPPKRSWFETLMGRAA